MNLFSNITITPSPPPTLWKLFRMMHLRSLSLPFFRTHWLTFICRSKYHGSESWSKGWRNSTPKPTIYIVHIHTVVTFWLKCSTALVCCVNILAWRVASSKEVAVLPMANVSNSLLFIISLSSLDHGASSSKSDVVNCLKWDCEDCWSTVPLMVWHLLVQSVVYFASSQNKAYFSSLLCPTTTL